MQYAPSAFQARRVPVMYPHEIASPGMAIYRHAMGEDPGIVQQHPDDNVLGLQLSAGILAGLLLVGVAINYQIGKAMAPDEKSEGKWAWGNAIGGTIFPPMTVGMALYKNYIR